MRRQAKASIEVGLKGTQFDGDVDVSSVERGCGELSISISCIMSVPKERIIEEFRRRVGKNVGAEVVSASHPFGDPMTTVILTISDQVMEDYTRSHRIAQFTSSVWFKVSIASAIASGVAMYYLRERITTTFDAMWWVWAIWNVIMSWVP